MDRRILFLDANSATAFNRVSRKKKENIELNGSTYISVVYYLNDRTLNELIAREMILKDTDGNLFSTTELERFSEDNIKIFKDGLSEEVSEQEQQEANPLEPDDIPLKRKLSNMASPPVIMGKEVLMYTITYSSYVTSEDKVLKFLKELMVKRKHIILRLDGCPSQDSMRLVGLTENDSYFVTSIMSSILFHKTDIGVLYLNEAADSAFLMIRKEGRADFDYKKAIELSVVYNPAKEINGIRVASIQSAIDKSVELAESLRVTHKEYVESLTKTYKDILSIDSHINSLRLSLENSSENREYYESLIINKEIANLSYNSGRLFVLTKVLSVFSDKTKRLHVVGQFLITIGSTSVNFKNLYGYVAGQQAAHINGDNACLGNIAQDVSKLVAEKGYEELIPVLLSYLKSARTSDGWGGKIKYFPLYPFQEDLDRQDAIAKGHLGKRENITLDGMFATSSFESLLVKTIRLQDDIPETQVPISIWS